MTSEFDDQVDIEPLLRMTDVVRYLRVTRQMVRKLMLSRQLRFIRVGRSPRFKREWVEALIQGDEGPGTKGKKGRGRPRKPVVDRGGIKPPKPPSRNN